MTAGYIEFGLAALVPLFMASAIWAGAAMRRRPVPVRVIRLPDHAARRF